MDGNIGGDSVSDKKMKPGFPYGRLEEAEATANRLRGLLREIEANANYCWICNTQLRSRGSGKRNGYSHADDCKLAKELEDE